MSNILALEGRSAIVTGASRGVGKGIALALARAGCRVAVNYGSSKAQAAETVAEAQALGVEAFAVQGNVSAAGDVERMMDTVVSRWPRLDILINNAGVQTWTPLVDVTEAEWDFVMDTNLKGCFLCTQAAARRMKAQGGGTIVNIGSGCSKVPFPKLVAYTASKGGIEMLTRVSAVELGPAGIRVNSVAPGAIEIERTQEENPDYASLWGKVTPLRRVGTPADVGAAVVFLVSDAASFISGQTLWVDGALFSQAVWAYET
jgi:NAD(P)-dependent dehydrogenase (short-subunit alcohol dehydrogenase family)